MPDPEPRHAHMGRDLAVVPWFVAHDAAEHDFVATTALPRHFDGGPVSPKPEERSDLACLHGRENLAQALILRLLTPAGALASLGHSRYGSRLHELIGRNKDAQARHLCRALVLEAVAQEPRVEPALVSFDFDIDAETSSSIAFTLAVRPRNGGEPITLALEVAL